MKYWIQTLLLLIVTSASVFGQSTFYVKAGATGSGESWANASADLQAMINNAQAGDAIWVAAGTYKPGSMPGATGTLTGRDVSFVLKSGVRIYGGFAGTETHLSGRNIQANPTILSGDIGAEGVASDNAHHVVVSVKNASGTLLDGVTITGGNANEPGVVNVDGIGIARFSGGGLYVNRSNLELKNVVITNNICEGGEDFFGNGGGIYAAVSELSIIDSEITENHAKRAPGKAGGTSGAIFIFGSDNGRSALNMTRVKVARNQAMNQTGAISVGEMTDAEFTDVDFIENKSSGGAAGALRVAGFAATDFSNFKMEGGSFVKNSATAAGGAVYVWSFTNYEFNRVVFQENVSSSAGGALFLFSGGGTAAPNDQAAIYNSLFYKNESRGTTLGGGAVFVSNGTQLTIANSTFYDNYALFNGGALGVFSNAVVKAHIYNSIFAANRSDGENQDFYVGPLASLDLSHSITQGQGADGVNGVKVNVNPQFASTDPGNAFFMRVLAASPAVDAGDNDKLPAEITKDLAGNDRIINGTVDIGAYEFKEEAGPTLSQTIMFSPDISKQYGDADFSPGGTASSGLPVSYETSDSSVAVFIGGKLSIRGAGIAQITALQPGDYQYLPAQPVTRTLTVEKAPLTIRPADTTMMQGDPLPEFRVIFSGLVYDETADDLLQKPVLTTDATSSSPEGDYTIVASGAASDNYTIAYETGILKVVTVFAEGKIRYVKPQASGTGSGLSWDNASANLQEMIEASSAGEEVWVAKGTYKPVDMPGLAGTAGGRSVSFVLKSGVGVYGGFSGNEVRRSDRNVESNETILSGDVGVPGDESDNAYHVVVSVNNTGNTVLDGFTITGGYASGAGNDVVSNVPVSQGSGAGIYIIGSQKLKLSQLTISGNQVQSTDGVGAGLYIDQSQTEITQSLVSDNLSKNQGAGFYLIGTAALPNQVAFSSVIFKNNRAQKNAAGGYVRYYTRAEFDDVRFEDNSGTEAAAIHAAGELDFFTNIKITNSTFSNNHATNGNGGAMLVAQYVHLEIYDSEFSGNTAGSQGGAIYLTGRIEKFSNLVIDRTIFRGNKLTGQVSNGGALRIAFYVDALIRNSSFIENESAGGAAISLVGTNLAPSENFHLIGNLFYKNKSTTTSSNSGGGAINMGVYLTANIINSTFYDNEAANVGGAINVAENKFTFVNIYNNIFHSNKAPRNADINWPTQHSTIDLKHNYLQVAGEHGVDGNIVSDNPGFLSTNPADPDFLLLSSVSDAVNAGNNSLVPAGLQTDRAGNDRIIHGTVDMGAFEYAGPPANPVDPQTITFGGSLTKTYGDPEFNPGATASSGLPVVYISSDSRVATISGDKIQIRGAGTVEITATQPGNAQFLPADPVSVTLTITKAPLVIRPQDVTAEEGAEFPLFTAGYAGFVYGDTEGSLTVPPTITTTATESSPVGTYPLVASGAASNNYSISYLEGTLTIIEAVRIPAENIKMDVWFSSAADLQVQVDMVSAQNALLLLYNNAGVLVYRADVALNPGTNKMVIPAGRMVPGVYILNVRGNGLRLEKKIIKR